MTDIYDLIWERFKSYANRVGATKKIVGDHAFRSPRFSQKTNKGRYVKFEGVERNGKAICVYDNKKGIITIIV